MSCRIAETLDKARFNVLGVCRLGASCLTVSRNSVTSSTISGESSPLGSDVLPVPLPTGVRVRPMLAEVAEVAPFI